MISVSRWKITLIILTCCLGILFAMPNVLPDQQRQHLPSWLQKTINLGLELRGGSHLQLEVDLKAVVKEHMMSLIEEVRNALRKEQVGYLSLTSSQSDGAPVVIFQLRDPSQKDKAQAVIKKIDSELEVTIDADGKAMLKFSETEMQKRTRDIVGKSIEVVRMRVDESGTKEPIIQRQGNDRIILQLPGVEDPAEVRAILGRTAKLSFKVVDYDAPPIEMTTSGVPHGHVPPGSEILIEIRDDGQKRYLVVKRQTMVSGDTLIDAQATVNEHGQPAVALRFNAVGARKFAEMSEKYLKRQFVIVLDDKVVSAPVFQSVIPDGHGQITGHFTIKEANNLALLLRSGALPAPLKVIEERTVGPSLGADSIRSGQLATILAIILVAGFMLMMYSFFGFIADIALIFNLIFLFAALSILQATLTLPGIAGIALAVGIAVDANVLIYERIKEELRVGVRPLAAIQAGYSRAMTTIIDSNLTTLIGTAVLFEFGSGPIRGLAVTLALGIVISLFTALSLTRLIIDVWFRKSQPKTLPI